MHSGCQLFRHSVSSLINVPSEAYKALVASLDLLGGKADAAETSLADLGDGEEADEEREAESAVEHPAHVLADGLCSEGSSTLNGASVAGLAPLLVVRDLVLL